MTGAPALSSCAIQPYFRSYVVLCISGGRHSLFSIIIFFCISKLALNIHQGYQGEGLWGELVTCECGATVL